MGVRGLTTYIAEKLDEYMRPHELCSCYLVIDALSLVCNLYNVLMKSESSFGGDYDEYYKAVKKFFLTLKKCEVTPIVLFDGGRERKKFKTVLSRLNERFCSLRKIPKREGRCNFFPLFLIQTFVDVLDDLDVIHVQCDLEADDEIAAVARALKCPVLSSDSDFYIFDVLYIPFSLLHLTPEKFPDSNGYYLKCAIYDIDNLLQQFPGLDKSMLPIIVTLLGNDYINSSLFHKFFNHVIMPKNKNLSFNQRKIAGVFNWMKKENPESAVELILTHLENKRAGTFLKAIKSSKAHYTSCFVSESVYDKLVNHIGDISLKKRKNTRGLPRETLQLYYRSRIHTFVMDMINLGMYTTTLQAEDGKAQSPHFSSLQLIQAIFSLVAPYTQNNRRWFNLYLNINNRYRFIRLGDTCDSLGNISLKEILTQSKEVRLKLLCQIVGMDESELSIVSCSNWSIFIMALIYWVKKLNSEILLAHIHAMILMAIANEAVQKHVGYFRTSAKFMKSKGALMESLKTSTVTPGTSEDFEGMLRDLTTYERLHVSNALLPYRRTDGFLQDKVFCLATVHLFATFQSCLYHMMQVNAILNYPLPHLRVSDFYSGSLLFNLYLAVKAKPPLERFAYKLFQGAPNFLRIYDYLCNCLCKYSEQPAPQPRRPRRKRRHNTHREELVLKSVDTIDDDYSDDGNIYSILAKLSKH